MIFHCKIEKGKLIFDNKEELDGFLKSKKDGQYVVKINKLRKFRSMSQNSALHLWFTQLAIALNDAGFDIRETLKQDFEIPWSATMVKELLWRPVQELYLKKISTTKLETKDIDIIFDIVNRGIGTKTGVHVPFPCAEELMSQDYEQ